MSKLQSLEEVSARITAGDKLLLAGDEEMLARLPAGEWIGGTIPYFMSEDGGVQTRRLIFATELPEQVTAVQLQAYDSETLPRLYHDACDNGFSVIILPAFSEIHTAFALQSPAYPEFATKPLLGWVAGVHLDDIGTRSPKVFLGKTSACFDNLAVVMHIAVPAELRAQINIVNVFDQGQGDCLEFIEDGFTASEVLVNGEKRVFSEYLRHIDVDPKLPLISNYAGAMINTSFQEIEQDLVRFYAPVFKGMEYRLAAPMRDYVARFTEQLGLSRPTTTVSFSCNCILNYLYSDLEGRKLDGFSGPATFGEIAYQLLNQTLVYLTIEPR